MSKVVDAALILICIFQGHYDVERVRREVDCSRDFGKETKDGRGMYGQHVARDIERRETRNGDEFGRRGIGSKNGLSDVSGINAFTEEEHDEEVILMQGIEH